MPISWIASSTDEISRTRAVLRAMKPEGVLDELGFLSILGLISQRLYPSTSTIMTRARYFIFVPAIFREVERQMRERKRNPRKLVVDLQERLCLALMETDRNESGIIGKRTNGKVVRTPSNTYWSALTALEIATRPIFESTYLDELDGASREPRVLRDDDGMAHDLDHDAFWDASMPESDLFNDRGEWLPGVSLNLTRSESRYLHRCFLRMEAGAEQSLLGLLLQREESGETLAETKFPWDFPNLPSELERVVHHAQRLSWLARGARLQYDALLFEKRAVPDTGTDRAFAAWFEDASAELRDWNFDDLWALPCLRTVAFETRSFFKEWTHSVVKHRSSQNAFEDLKARQLLRMRELRTRGSKGPLRSTFHLNDWRPPTEYRESEVYGLTYRQGIGTTIVRDICQGLQKGAR